MKQSWQKAVLPHVYAVLIFLGLSFIFCSPVLEGMELQQGDNINWKAMSAEAISFYEKTGETPLWTNTLFGGMPTYQIFMHFDNFTAYLHTVFTLGLPKPANYLFMGMLGFYFLLSVMGFRNWISVIGAIAVGLSTYNMSLIAAGHDTKMFCITYMAPVIAGILLTYRGRLWLGGIVTSLMLCLLIMNNHYQILYYTLIISFIIGIAHLIHAVKTKTLPQYAKATGVLLIFGMLAVLPSTAPLWTTYEYGKYTMRGGHSELTPLPGSGAVKTSDGLERGYAFEWSQGGLETLTVLIPNLYGGSGNESIGTSSETYKELTAIGVPAPQAEQFADSAPLYWGPQPFTGGPSYFGAAIIFLFVLAILLVKDWQKWWIITAIVFAIILAMGRNFALVNNFLFDYMPMYNKFRTPTVAMVIPQVLVPFLACWVLNEIVTLKYAKDELLKQLKMAVYISGGLCLLFILASFGMMSFTAEHDGARSFFERSFGNNPDMVQKMFSAIISDRASALRSDAFRSLVIILLAAGLIWMLVKERIKLPVFLLLTGLIVTFDLWQIDKRYLNKDNFVTPTDYSNLFAPTAVDQAIKKDPDPYYRVLNVTQNILADAMTSYHHKSVGGYHAARLSLYQDIIDRQIMKNNMQVLNMLNTKYVITPDQQGQLTYQQNPGAKGNAWFVSQLKWAANADEEMAILDHLQVDDTAVVDVRFKAGLENYTFGKDSSSNIKLTQYGLNELQYQSHNSQNGFAVFSEVYYPKGWNVYIDDKKGEIVKVNYVLRGVKIPAGDHKITLRFEPESYQVGNLVSRYSSILMLLLFFGALGVEIWKRFKK